MSFWPKIHMINEILYLCCYERWIYYIICDIALGSTISLNSNVNFRNPYPFYHKEQMCWNSSYFLMITQFIHVKINIWIQVAWPSKTDLKITRQYFIPIKWNSNNIHNTLDLKHSLVIDSNLIIWAGLCTFLF